MPRVDSFDAPTVGVARAKLRDFGKCPDARTVITSGLCRPESHGKPRGARDPTHIGISTR
jgi:hypothetical protein